MSVNKITVSSLPYCLDNTSDPIVGRSAETSPDMACPSVPTSAVTTAATPSSTTTKETSSPVVFIDAPIVVMILALIALIVVMVTVILACKKKRILVKDKDLRENVSYSHASQSSHIQLSPHTGQIENTPTQVHSDTEKANGVECTAGIYVYVMLAYNINIMMYPLTHCVMCTSYCYR